MAFPSEVITCFKVLWEWSMHHQGTFWCTIGWRHQGRRIRIDWVLHWAHWTKHFCDGTHIGTKVHEPFWPQLHIFSPTFFPELRYLLLPIYVSKHFLDLMTWRTKAMTGQQHIVWISFRKHGMPQWLRSYQCRSSEHTAIKTCHLPSKITFRKSNIDIEKTHHVLIIFL